MLRRTLLILAALTQASLAIAAPLPIGPGSVPDDVILARGGHGRGPNPPCRRRPYDACVDCFIWSQKSVKVPTCRHKY